MNKPTPGGSESNDDQGSSRQFFPATLQNSQSRSTAFGRIVIPACTTLIEAGLAQMNKVVLAKKALIVIATERLGRPQTRFGCWIAPAALMCGRVDVNAVLGLFGNGFCVKITQNNANLSGGSLPNPA
jgi:hypothetical protein